MKTVLEEFTLQNSGVSICGFHMSPEKIQGVVVLVHGFGEHSGRYVNTVVPVLLNAGFAVVAYDNVGHGKSSGKRGHCSSYESLMSILNDVIAHATQFYDDPPLFLYGHSMGGNLVLNYALRKNANLHGIIATSPYLRLAFQPPKWKMILGKVMLKLMPSITLNSGLDPKGISRIPEEVEKYNTDPLIHDKVSPMFSFPIMEAGEWAIENAHLLSVQTLLLHGAADPIIDPLGTKAFHENSNQTTFKSFEGGYHELHNDLCKDEMLRCISDWLTQVSS